MIEYLELDDAAEFLCVPAYLLRRHCHNVDGFPAYEHLPDKRGYFFNKEKLIEYKSSHDSLAELKEAQNEYARAYNKKRREHLLEYPNGKYGNKGNSKKEYVRPKIKNTPLLNFLRGKFYPSFKKEELEERKRMARENGAKSKKVHVKGVI